MKNVIKISAVLIFLSLGLCPSAQSSGVNYYRLKTCTGLEPDGTTFEGAMCRDKVEEGPCVKESVCYKPEDDVIPY